MKTVQTLVRVSQYALDEKRKVLVLHLDELETLRARRQDIEDELVKEQAAARAAPDIAITYGGYASNVIHRRAELDREIVVKQREAELAREEVQEAFEELKKYEITLERLKLERARELAKIEQDDLDEMGLNGYRRKSEGDNG